MNNRSKAQIGFFGVFILLSFLPKISSFFADPNFLIPAYLFFVGGAIGITSVLYENHREKDSDIISAIFVDFGMKKFILNDLVRIINGFLVVAFWGLQYFAITNGYYNNLTMAIAIIVAEAFILMIARIMLELLVAITRIAENTER